MEKKLAKHQKETADVAEDLSIDMKLISIHAHKLNKSEAEALERMLISYRVDLSYVLARFNAL
jgi:hypothetical protein